MVRVWQLKAEQDKFEQQTWQKRRDIEKEYEKRIPVKSVSLPDFVFDPQIYVFLLDHSLSNSHPDVRKIVSPASVISMDQT